MMAMCFIVAKASIKLDVFKMGLGMHQGSWPNRTKQPL
jgi:hypothetical protein